MSCQDITREPGHCKQGFEADSCHKGLGTKYQYKKMGEINVCFFQKEYERKFVELLDGEDWVPEPVYGYSSENDSFV